MTNATIVPQGTIINGRVIGGMEKKNKQWHYHWTCSIHPDKSGLSRLKDIKIKRPQCCYHANSSGVNNPNWKGTGILGAKKFNAIRRGAAARRGKIGIPFEVTPQNLIDIWNWQDGLCVYTGRDLVDINSSQASLDRIDSSYGYIEGNIQWVHTQVNLAKQSLSSSEFVHLVNEIYKHMRNTGIIAKDVFKIVEVKDRVITAYLDEEALSRYGLSANDPRWKIGAFYL